MADILIIDDDDLMVEIMADCLGDEGHAVRSALDGPAGLAAAQDRCPALVILDMNLPGLDGREVARRLRAGEATRRVPILAITGDTAAADRDAALQAGCDAFLGKPLDVLRLIDRVSALLR